MKFKTEEELLDYTSNIVGKTFAEIDSKGLLEKTNLNRNKGVLGHVVETGFYKYPLNSDSEADFAELGIELKVTAYIKNKNGVLRAKERLSLSKIDFNKIIYETFETSHVLGKCQKMLIIWYEYDKSKDIKDFVITHYQLYDMNQDRLIFENDFQIIKQKVLDGKAHEISEGDTSYLGACTKARLSTDRTTQPFSEILAKPRAFSLKNSYMSGILKDMDKSQTLLTFKSDKTNDYKTVLEYVNDKLSPYFGKTQAAIYNEIIGGFNSDKVPKNINKLISDKLIGHDAELPNIHPLFRKTKFIIKNLPITENYKPRERMSFRTLNLSDFDDDWEDSYWRNFFEETTLIVICYQEQNKSKNGFRVLRDVKKLVFNDDDFDSFEKTYNQIKFAIDEKDIDLLPISTNGFKNLDLQIAPKGVKGDNAYENFFKRNKTKVAFMLSKDLLHRKLPFF